MGLAASQARLLTLTSRSIDLELKCMQLSAQQIRNASDACSLSEDYNNQLDILAERSQTEGDELYIYKPAEGYEAPDLSEVDVDLTGADIKSLGYNVVLSKFSNELGSVAAPNVRNQEQIKADLDNLEMTSKPDRDNFQNFVDQIAEIENTNTQLTAQKEAYRESASLKAEEIQSLKSENDTYISDLDAEIKEHEGTSQSETSNINSANSNIARWSAQYATQSARMTQAQNDMNFAMKTNDKGERVPDQDARQRAGEIYAAAQQACNEATNEKAKAENAKREAEMNKATAESAKRNAESKKLAAEAKSKAYQDMLDSNNVDVEAKCKEIDAEINNNNAMKMVWEASRDSLKGNIDEYDAQQAKLEGELAVSQQVYSKDESKTLHESQMDNESLITNLMNGKLVIVDAAGHKCSYEDLVEAYKEKNFAPTPDATWTIDRTAYNAAVDKADRDYDQAQKKLSLQDKRIQMEMTQTQTQLNACNKEMESVKSLIEKNVERGFDYSI